MKNAGRSESGICYGMYHTLKIILLLRMLIAPASFPLSQCLTVSMLPAKSLMIHYVIEFKTGSSGWHNIFFDFCRALGAGQDLKEFDCDNKYGLTALKRIFQDILGNSPAMPGVTVSLCK